MTWGVLCGVLAGAFWGTVFIAPKFLSAFSPWELTFGRYIAYALVAFVALVPTLRSTLRKIDRADLAAMLRHGVAGNALYYVLLGYGVQLAGVTLTSLIIGVLPLSVTLAGRRDQGAVPLRVLAWPLLVVAAGIACINADLFLHAADATGSVLDKAIGLACAVGGLICWTWYALDNTRYLKRVHKFSSREWSGLYGLASGVIVSVCAAVWWAFGGSLPAASPHRDWGVFWAVCLFLAVGASLVGNHLWNIACRLVPVTLSGQLIVFETLFALAYGFVQAKAAPRPLEWAAMVLLSVGVAWTVRLHAVDEPAH
jgi:drug/metabolite transporter (DMT)-like permease